MTVEGAVEARNDRGVKVDGQWVNRSNFGKPINLPEVGTRIRAEVDAKGFLKSIELLDGEYGAPAPRDQRIARLTVLKAAANFAATRTDIKSADVLTIADRWLAWLERDDAP